MTVDPPAVPKTGPSADAAPPRRCGLIAIVGRPNVGKSTLLNALVGQKISITSRKAQTTRHRIMGVCTHGEAQFVFLDTPGFQTQHAAALNRVLNRSVRGSLADADLVLFVVEAGKFGAADESVLRLLLAPAAEGPPNTVRPIVLVANKLDQIKRRADLAPWLQQMATRHAFAEFVPLSAEKPTDAARLLGILAPHLPEQPWMFEPDALTDRSDRFLAAEIIREKLFRLLGDELPYTSTVVIDRYLEPGEPGGRVEIDATIVVGRDAHKGMVIGAGGERLKRIGTEARLELERLLDSRVQLTLWVQVRSGWADDEAHLRSYGYE